MQSDNGNKKIKVLFLSAWYPSKYDSMLGLFVQNHAIAVSQLCEVIVLYIHAAEHYQEMVYTIESNEYGTIKEHIVFYKKCKHPIPLISSIIKSLRFLKAYSKGLGYIKHHYGLPDIIHVNILTRTGIPALFLKKRKKIPYIITEHWSRYLPQRNEFKGIIRKYLTKIIIHNASAVTTVTNNLKEAMIACGLKHSNYLVIPNVVDINLFKISEEIASEKKIISHISCFDESAKNIKAIIRLAKTLAENRSDFEIRLIGDGIDKNMIYNYAEELGVLGKYIFFDGVLTGIQLVKAINRSQFVLLFSNYENFPAVIPESFACGKPVLSTNVGGISEYINEEYGILTEPGNEDELLEKANYLLDHYSLYRPETLHHYAETQFSNKVIANQFLKVYLQALNL